MPTGSFKDRGASVMLSLLRAQGIARGAGGQLRQWRRGGCRLCGGGRHARRSSWRRASTSPAKTVQMRAHGAAVELIPGTRQDTADAAAARSASVFYASHNWHPFFLHGTKTLAYELWEDLGFRAPDNIIVPCGAGLERAGLRDRLFRTSARRRDRDAAAPLRRPAGELRPDRRRLPGRQRRAGARRQSSPPSPRAPPSPHRSDCAEVLGALRETRWRRGDAGRGRDRRRDAGTRRAPGFTSSRPARAGPAAHRRLLASGAVTPEQTTVLVLTGTGLKATPRIAEMLGVPV